MADKKTVAEVDPRLGRRASGVEQATDDRVADASRADVMAALDKVRTRDAELLQSLAR